ncbi:hypothetical protein ONZ45_g9825 [Pleurotus djamor]|nr:hypothetical protein ONZ45_g9825 [Pleurotus djamor]
MADKVEIFLTGATGYIGGTILQRLLQHPRFHDLRINTLVRSAEKAEKLRRFGFTPIIGSLDDSDLMEGAAFAADVVISMADSDHLSSLEAILSGMKRKFETTGLQPVLIHTSGTGVLMDNAAGMYKGETVWDDSDPVQMASIPLTQPHRIIDTTILKADEAGYMKSFIILPSTIWGVSTGSLVESGISNAYSQQIPRLIHTSISRRQGGMVGLGKNIWPNVNIAELSDLYLLIFDAAITKSEIGHGLNGYYFGENGEHSLYVVGKAIAETLVKLGIGSSPEPTTFTKQEIDKYLGNESLGSNSRCRANHSRFIGWRPTRSTVDMLSDTRAETEKAFRCLSPS